MADATTDAVGAVADELFDKYLLPKAALTVILAASLVGTALTLELTGQWAPLVAVTKWAYLVSLGVLLGGLLWKHAFVRPSDLADGAADYCDRMYARYDRIATAALGGLAATGAALLAVVYAGRVAPEMAAALAASLALTVAAGAADTLGDREAADRFRTPAGLTALVGAAAATAATATADVALAHGTGTAAAVRSLHLLAFGAWVGGAVWNIFVAVPTGQTRPTPPVVQAAGEQLERFRWAVRAIIPTLVLTGLFQSVAVLGTRLAPYVETVVGLAVLAKLGLVVVLFGIFLTCPMWRACSPIDGVCDLADLDAGTAEEAD
ncbi:MAG: hypothetical protein ABEJ88_06470 [Halobacterium sp.]